MAQTRPADLLTRRSFTCPGCGHEQTFDPAECPWILTIAPDDRGGTERIVRSRVRCGRCGLDQEVLLGRG